MGEKEAGLTVYAARELLDVVVCEKLLNEGCVVLVVEPTGHGLTFPIKKADVDRGKEPTAVLAHYGREMRP